jgi:hypothetical protein
MRYMLPVVPLLCVAAGSFVDALARRWAGPAGRRLAFLLAVLLIAPSAHAAWQHDRLLARPDTRLLAARWIEAQVPDGTRIAMHSSDDSAYLQVRRSRRWLQEQLEDVRAGGLEGRRLARMLQLEDYPPRPSYYVLGLQAINPLNRRTIWTTYSTTRLAEEGIRWVVTHEHPLAYARLDSAFEKQLARDAVLVKSFDPFIKGAGPPVYDPVDAYYVPVAGFAGVERPGPLIRIYQPR